MYYNQTPHALNLKAQDAIVFVDAFGEKIQVTAEMLGTDEFEYWKTWFDNDLHEEAKEEHIYKDHTVSIEELSASGYTVPDCETLMIEAEERKEREELKEQLGIAFFTCLSDIQQARMWLYAIKGYNTCQIAAMERIAQKNVYTSIMKARKNILNFLKKGGYKTAVFAAYSEGVIN